MEKLKNKIIAAILSMISKFDSTVEEAINILSEDMFSGELYNIAKAVSDVITPLALTIIMVVFLCEFLSVTVKFDILKREYWMRVILKMVMAKVAIDVSFELMEAIYATGAEFVIGVGDTGSTLGNSVGVVLTGLVADLSAFEALGIMVTMGIAFIAIWACGMLITVIAYARSFELLTYIAVAPLPCAFLPMENSRITKKFFLSFAGVCLQGMFIILSIKLYAVVCEEALVPLVEGATEMSDVAFNMLLGALVLVMAVFKSGSWAKSILDAA